MSRSFLEITEESVDKKSRIKRINDAVFKNGVINIEEIYEIPEKLRQKLKDEFEILSLQEECRKVSSDGTVKFLFRLKDSLFIESVFLIDHKNRVTMCISSQVGCRMGCVFCKTGKMGLKRDLTRYEIVSQVIYIYNYMLMEKGIKSRVFNIVFMGMGEPFDNYDNLIGSINILTNPSYFSLHPSWITVSTCGLLDKIEPILELFPKLRVTVSLNNSVQSKRAAMMPISKKYSVEDIAFVLKKVYAKYKTRLTLEFVAVKNVNMGLDDIEALEIFNDKAFHINIIPVNSNDDNIIQPDEADIQRFSQELIRRGFFVTRRTRRGADIQADCGQLYFERS